MQELTLRLPGSRWWHNIFDRCFMQHRTIEPTILYFGTPVALITTIDQHGNANIGPMSSVWALGWTMMLGLECASKTYQNLIETKECVVNLADHSLFSQVERIASLTGASPIPDYKRGRYRYESDKFTAGGFSKMEAVQVRPPRIAECLIQLEAVMKDVIVISDDPKEAGVIAAVAVRVVKIHAHESIMADSDHIDPTKWNPLIYNFRHYRELGKELGKTFKAEI
jgi:flavin reductase (DIM6/NTAB) family NADH-FMN oxidoreductase RutF